MRRRITLTAHLAAATVALPLASFPLAAQAQETVPPAAKLAVVDVNGTGCEDGSWIVETDPSGTAALVHLTRMRVTGGTGVLTCELDFRVDVAKGWRFRIGAFQMNGSVETSGNVRARLSSYGRLVGQPATISNIKLMSMRSTWSHRARLTGGTFSDCTGVDEASAGTFAMVPAATGAGDRPGKLEVSTIRVTLEDFEWERCPERR